IQFPGSVVVTSTKLDIINDTARRRKRTRGPCLLFNPEGRSGRPSTLRWNPVAGCDDPNVAIDRAGYLLAGTAGGTTGDREFWTNNANKVLRAYLFAAARSGASLMDVKHWANNSKDQSPLQMLIADDNAPDGWADELRQILGAYDRYRDSVFATLAQTFDFLGTPGVREVVELGEGERSFDVRRFLTSKATLYLIGAQRDYGSIAPLFSALTGMIYETAKAMADESRSGRLDPPVLFALDEAPNICPVPLHRWTSEAGSRGIPIITCIQSFKQLADVWGETRGAIIWENSTVKMFLPSGSDDETLKKVSNLCGTYEVPRVTTTKNAEGSSSSSTVMETRPVFEPHNIRMPNDFTALVIKANKKPVTVRIEPFWERRAIRRSEARAPQRVVPAAPTPRPPTRGGTPVASPSGGGARIIPMPAPTTIEAEEEQSG
nr:type IV secretory system conjugative DNA transfer family protein [Actinomycetota bacterium]